MSRTKKIDVNSEGFKLMVQETYNDISLQKNEANRLFKEIKLNADIGSDTGIENVPIAGPTLVNLLKVIDSSVDKKLKLLKILHQYLKDGTMVKLEKTSDGEMSSSLIPSGTDRAQLTSLLREMQKDKELD